MDYLAVDIGTYSIKFLNFRIERKRIEVDHFHEVTIPEVSTQQVNEEDEDLIMLPMQMAADIIREYVDSIKFDGKILFQIPAIYITTRYLTLPVANIKKAELLIPFQLDEELPFPISTIHYCTYSQKQGETTHANVHITSLEEFDAFYKIMSLHDLLPRYLTCEAALMQHYVDNHQMAGSFVVMDMGHTATKAYFFQNNYMMANHITHVGGRSINEVISKTYNISAEEAVNYKHENCFVLTDDQMDSVTENQKEFALLMRQTLWPLVQEFRRWELGYRAKHGHRVRRLYVTGGSANIKNIKAFLAHHLSIPCEIFDPFENPEKYLHSMTPAENHIYSQAQLLAASQLSKKPVPNFLKGNYSNNVSDNIPMHSTIFVAARVFVASLLIILSLFVERLYLNKEHKIYNSKISKYLRSPELKLTPANKRKFARIPSTAIRYFERKSKSAQDEIKSIMSATKKNAISPLVKLSEELSNMADVDLSSFESNGDTFEAVFYSVKHSELIKLKQKLQSADFGNADIDLKPASTTLKISASMEEF